MKRIILERGITKGIGVFQGGQGNMRKEMCAVGVISDRKNRAWDGMFRLVSQSGPYLDHISAS